ncbi:uncharacterized protein [Parasteatoda tepidariorum]|uniref:uncharacterized protein n=1 Tax=Parasteatoda tepidariorum TaxID=114398 RepID=UPI0039BD25B9
METLKKRRSILKGKVKRINNILKPKFMSGEIERAELDVFSAQINETWVELNEIHTEIIISCKNEEEASNMKEFDDLASNIDTLRINIARELSELKSKVNNTNNGGVSPDESKPKLNESCLKLLKFELPSFYGDFNNWMSFKELFLSSIDKNPEVTELQKFQYLFASLKDVILIFFILGKLDDTLRQRWELSLTNQDIPTFLELAKFLEQQAESISNQTECKPRVLPKKAFENNVVVNKTENLCNICNENHSIVNCPMYNKMSVDDRWKVVKSKKLCINCLRKFHMANKCRFTNTCKACHRKHHTSLHRFYSNSEEPNVSNTVCYSNSNLDNADSENVPTVRENIQLSTTCLNSNSVDSNTLLSTALIKVKNVEGNLITCRALINNGSQKCLISKRCETLLQLTETVSNKTISAINNKMIETNLNEVILEFKPHFNENREFNCTALVVNKITSDLPNFKFDSGYWPHLQGLKLADPAFFIASPIDILLGADMYAEMLLGQLISGKKGTPVAINSHLESQLRAFWELESIPQTELRTKDEADCESFYDSTVTWSSGRYTVRLPFKSHNNFGKSASQALKRFNYLEAKLSKNNSLRQQYSKFMLEYLQLGHMELVPLDEIDKEKSFYLPHHFVIKEDSSTTKLRVVFDASAKDSWKFSK